MNGGVDASHYEWDQMSASIIAIFARTQPTRQHLDTVPRKVLQVTGRHLRPAGVVDADEEDGGAGLAHGYGSG